MVGEEAGHGRWTRRPGTVVALAASGLAVFLALEAVLDTSGCAGACAAAQVASLVGAAVAGVVLVVALAFALG